MREYVNVELRAKERFFNEELRFDETYESLELTPC